MKLLLLTLLLVTFSSTASADALPALSCFGTEPFWNLTTTSEGTLTFGNPGSLESKTLTHTTLVNASGTAGGFAFQIEAKSTDHYRIKLNVIKGECNDGMSDRIYPFSTLVEAEGVVFYGCCK